MPRKAKELGPLEVKRITRRGLHAVGGVAGLLLQVKDTGARSWILRTWVGPKRRNIGLGGFPDVTLAQARDKARELRAKVSDGIDPVAERKAARAALWAAEARGLTFGDAVDRYLADKLDEFRNEKHRKQWRSTLDRYAAPELGKMLVADIAPQDVVRVLKPIWAEKTETASRLRGRIEAVLSWATVVGHREGDNPARWRGNLSELLPKPGKVATVDNWPALALDDAAQWWAALATREGMGAAALRFLTLTAARSGDVRGATWDEIDLKAGLWTIPAARMKARREHRVPLTAEALALLKTVPRLEGSPYVFPAARGGMLSDMSISAVMRRMHEAEVAADRRGYLDPRNGRPAVPHGLRSTFRDWAAERTNYPRDMAEIALAHIVGSEVERAYRRGDQIEKRRGMMAAWGRFLRGEAGAKVVAIGAGQ